MMRSLSKLYGQISLTHDGETFQAYTPGAFAALLQSERWATAPWAIYADIGGEQDGETYVTERVMLCCSRNYGMQRSRRGKVSTQPQIIERAGSCPVCGESMTRRVWPDGGQRDNCEACGFEGVRLPPQAHKKRS